MSAHPVKRTWVVAEENRSATGELSGALGVPRIAAHLLRLRGITTLEEGRRFLCPSIDQLTDPFLLTDMRVAIDRIEQARQRGEHVFVFGDYDVDGISGTALLVTALRRHGIDRCSFGMPSRLTEGYGLSPDRVEAAHTQGVSLIITVDNGISAHEAAAAARRLGIDLIVTDHHPFDKKLPDALAVVNPKREGEGHPLADASGAAVAFKVATALTGTVEDLDVVALGTIADIVPLRGENRALVALGLERMIARPRIGIRKLAEVAGVNMEQITAENIAFQLAPRLNAAGRLGNGLAPLELLLTESAIEASRLALALNDANEKRRDIEREIYEQAVEELEAAVAPNRHSIVLASRDWHPGVIGIVASRLHARYNRPVVLLALDADGLGRGSARSTPLFDMAGALRACEEHLIRFGGHAAAAGLTLNGQDFEKFRASFEAEAAKRSASYDPAHVLEIDAQVALSEIDGQLVKALDRLEPFGHMNPAPLFCAYGVTPLPYSARELRGGHLRLTLRQDPKVFEAIGFRMADLLEYNLGSRPIDIAFTPRFNTWRGETTVQLVLKDVHIE